MAIKRKHGVLVGFMLLIFTLGYFGVAYAENKPNFHIGAMEIHPLASIKGTYDSNIYYQNTDTHSDWIMDYGAGASVQMPLVADRGDDYMAKASYVADWIRFSDNTERSRVDHHASGLLSAQFSNDWGVKSTDSFVRTADPPNDELAVLEKRMNNVFDNTLSYTREKIRLDNAYTLTTDTYDRISYLDRNDHRYTGTLFYQLYPKTSVLGEVNVGRILYKRQDFNSNSTYYQLRLGMEGAYWPKVTGLVKAGYKFADYDQSDKKNFSGFTAFMNLKYDISRRTNMNLYGERGSDESSYATNSFYEFNKIGLSLKHLLTERLVWDVGPYYSYDRYPSDSTENGETGKRHDSIFAIGTGLTYELREYLLLNLKYDYRQRDSKFSVFSYDDHKVSVGAQLVF